MGRTVAILWHSSFSIGAGVLYFFFVLPRWYELMGDIPHPLGTLGRIVCGVVIGLAALPVVFTLLRSRKPEYGTPWLALSLRTWSIVAHVLAGVLIVGTAISEILLSLDSVGQWLFGIYGAAAAIAILAISGFYLSFVAELPPPPPKPLKPKKPTQRRFRRKKGEKKGDESTEAEAAGGAETSGEEAETPTEGAPEDETSEQEQPAPVTAGESPSDGAETPAEEDTATAERGRLRNRRPSGKTNRSSRRRQRSRSGIAVED